MEKITYSAVSEFSLFSKILLGKVLLDYVTNYQLLNKDKCMKHGFSLRKNVE
jgi:hypothetical protein